MSKSNEEARTGLGREDRGHHVGFGFLDPWSGIRTQRLPLRGRVVCRVVSLEPFRSVVRENPDEGVVTADHPSPVDAEPELLSKGQDAPGPSFQPYLHLALLDPVDPKLRDRVHRVASLFSAFFMPVSVSLSCTTSYPSESYSARAIALHRNTLRWRSCPLSRLTS